MEDKQPLVVSHNINLIEDDNEAEKKIIEVIIQVKDELDNLQAPVVLVDKDRSSKERTQPSIHKIPEFMRKVQAKAFEPQLVSFGPYHHGNLHLASMEQEKRNAFLRFKAKNKLDSELIVKSVSDILENLLGSYDKLDDTWKQNRAKFLQVMIVDGCFMLDFFHNCPISLRNMSIEIRRDILLLENQLPMELLKKLHSIVSKKSNQETDKELRSLICMSMLIKDKKLGKELHILDMYRAWLLEPTIDYMDRTGKPKPYKPSDIDCQIIPQAILLHEAGVKFKQSATKSLTDVRFDSKRGVLELPLFVIDDNTETTFLNVMAFEKLHLKAGNYKVTSFITLMNNLIDVDKDVALLESKTIIANVLGNDQDAANLFGLLGQGVAIDLDNDIIDLQYNLNQYRLKPWRKWSASLQHNYFQNPWASISVIAAVFGFAILLIQAVYQIVEFHLGEKNK